MYARQNTTPHPLSLFIYASVSCRPATVSDVPPSSTLLIHTLWQPVMSAWMSCWPVLSPLPSHKVPWLRALYQSYQVFFIKTGVQNQSQSSMLLGAQVEGYLATSCVLHTGHKDTWVVCWRVRSHTGGWHGASVQTRLNIENGCCVAFCRECVQGLVPGVQL